MTILVVGARGNVGSRVIAKLAEGGHSVRGTSRDVSNLTVPEGAETVELDITNPHNAEAALRDVESIFLYATIESSEAFIKAAREAGVQYVVLLSSPDVYEAAEDSIIRIVHTRVEKELADSGLKHTVIYPGWLSSNARRDWRDQIRTKGRIAMAFPEAHFVPIHEDDIADVTVALLTRNAYPGRALTMTGPTSLTQMEIVNILADAIGKPIFIDTLTRQQAIDQREDWMPEAVMETLLDYAEAAIGVPGPINNTVERITGNPPRTFVQWAKENRADFL